jgi:hypothetical protein
MKYSRVEVEPRVDTRRPDQRRLSLGAWCGEFLKRVTGRVRVPTTLAGHRRGLVGYATGVGYRVTAFRRRVTTFRGRVTGSSDRVTGSSDRVTGSSDRVTGFRDVDCEPTNRVTSLVERGPGLGKRGTGSVSVIQGCD